MNLNKLKQKKAKNKRERREFVKYWAQYVREHSDKDWSQQQNKIIDSQLTKQNLTREDEN